MAIKVISCIELFHRLFDVPFAILGVNARSYRFFLSKDKKGSTIMSNKVTERRERKIKKAVETGNWKEVDRLLQQEQSNAERRDRYHHKKSLEKNISRNYGKQRELHEIVASSDLNPKEALEKKELEQAVNKAKEILEPIDRGIVEMVAEQGCSYKVTARCISEHYKKMSDVTVKSHYLKAIRKLASLLEDYR